MYLHQLASRESCLCLAIMGTAGAVGCCKEEPRSALSRVCDLLWTHCPVMITCPPLVTRARPLCFVLCRRYDQEHDDNQPSPAHSGPDRSRPLAAEAPVLVPAIDRAGPAVDGLPRAGASSVARGDGGPSAAGGAAGADAGAGAGAGGGGGQRASRWVIPGSDGPEPGVLRFYSSARPP